MKQMSPRDAVVGARAEIKKGISYTLLAGKTKCM